MSIAEMTQVCAELVERWDDVSLYFGTIDRPTAATEVRTKRNFEVNVFEDRFSRSRFTVLKYLLSISKWFLLLPICGVLYG